MAIEAKEQVERCGFDAGDAIARATNVVVPAVTETVQRWSADVGEAVSIQQPPRRNRWRQAAHRASNAW